MNSKSHPQAPIKVVSALVLYLVGFLLLGAITAVALHRIAPHIGFLSQLIEEEGIEKITRRTLSLWAFLLLIPLMKFYGWKGFRDAGWDASRPIAGFLKHKKPFLMGVLYGVFALSLLGIIQVLLDVRFGAGRTIPFAVGHLAKYFMAGLFIAFLEETFMRGIFFRVLARNLHGLMAAVIVSGLFAWAHYLAPTPTAFEEDSFLSAAAAVFKSLIFNTHEISAAPVRFIHYFMFGLVLCYSVAKLGHIWLAIGIHAGAVTIMRFNGYLTDITQPLSSHAAWLGSQSNGIDSWLGTALIGGLLITIFFQRESSVAE